MLTTIVWTLFVGLTPTTNFTSLADCAAQKSFVAQMSPHYQLLACVPQDKR